MKSWEKFFLLTCLYCAQGLPYGFFTQALPVWMRKQNVELKWIGLTSLLALPWALKFLWAPFVESRYSSKIGKRRSWLLPLQALTLVFASIFAFFPPQNGDYSFLVIGFLLANLLAATQDIAADGLAVELLNHQERGFGNGIQVAGYRIGMIVGGGLLLIFLGKWGWNTTFLWMGFFLFLLFLPVFFFQENRWIRREKKQENLSSDVSFSTWQVLFSFLKQDKMVSWLVLLFAYKAGEHFATGMLKPLLVDFKFKVEEIGMMLGIAGFTAGLLGSLVGGLLINGLGRKKSLLGFAFLQTLAVALYLLPFYGWKDMNSLLFFLSVEHFVGGMATVALFTIMMDQCRVEKEGSDYTLQASIVVIASGLASSLSGISAQSLGYKAHFFLATLLCLCVPLLVHFLYEEKDTAP